MAIRVKCSSGRALQVRGLLAQILSEKAVSMEQVSVDLDDATPPGCASGWAPPTGIPVRAVLRSRASF